MFDLHANFVAKIGGKEDFSNQIAKHNWTFLLCVSKEVMQHLFEEFPKSRQVISKLALYRRMAFVEQLDKHEEFLQIKNEQMKDI